MRRRVLIVQNEVMSYRRPVYHELGKYHDVTVLHSGSPAARPGDQYRDLLTPVKRWWRFSFQEGVIAHLDPAAFDVVIVMFDLWWPNNIRAAFRRQRPPLIFWGHRHSLNPVANVIRYWAMRRADAHLLYGDEDVPDIIANGIPREAIFIAPNTQYVSNAQDTSGAVPKRRLLFVGRLQRLKRVHVLIDAFARALPRIPADVVLSIVGNGFEEQNLHALASSLGLGDRVQFHGDVRGDDELLPLFRESIAYLSPHHVGLGVLHAFAYGVAAVTTARLRQRHGQEFMNLRHDENALVIEAEGQLTDAIVKLCNDLPMARRLGAAGYRTFRDTRRLEQMIDGFRASIAYATERAQR